MRAKGRLLGDKDHIFHIGVRGKGSAAPVIGARNENYETLSLIDFINLFGILYALCHGACVRRHRSISWIPSWGTFDWDLKHLFFLVCLCLSVFSLSLSLP